jgi:hypothetical protein
MERQNVRIIVELEPGEPICGSLAREGEQQVPFEGMLGFLSAFDHVRAPSGPTEPEAGDGP